MWLMGWFVERLPKNSSIQGLFRLQTHDSLVLIGLKSLGGTFSIEAFLRFQGKIVKSYRVLRRVIVCRVGAIMCIVRVIVCRVELSLRGKIKRYKIRLCHR